MQIKNRELFLFFSKKRLCTEHRLIFTHRHRFASSAQRFDKDRLRLFIKASLPARGVTINGDDRRFACTFAAPTAATSVSPTRHGVIQWRRMDRVRVAPASEYFFIFFSHCLVHSPKKNNSPASSGRNHYIEKGMRQKKSGCCIFATARKKSSHCPVRSNLP